MRFEIGELAIITTQLYGFGGAPDCMPGTEVEILEHNPEAPDGEPTDYLVMGADGIDTYVMENELRKRYPPEEPADEEFQLQLNQWLTENEHARDRT